ncbi:alpha/beta hydrolase [Planctomicrobium piriforme]|uniref:Lysophospholipase, alpha-beta hydrolase superfamily n=1 Tax=Planctomicrobium piriforme TaxID=1576369 RepID=A0A1I3BBM6_9PLAN|nr:alpha/beta hydrolase [Planctomicrobium piriforme]SFH59359.1 Lysophospholipase, alpha-beta hydrolase superfamily [Planctomicrobium piriforme]
MTNDGPTIPHPAVEEAFHSSASGFRIYSCVHTGPETKGVILLTHGLGEHSGRYGHVIHQMQEAGLATVRFDLRGHGRSDGPRGHAGSYESLLDDLSLMYQWTRARFPGIPLVVYGHSLGGNLVANWCLRRRLESSQIAGAVLSSPWFLLTAQPSPLKVAIIKMLAGYWPNFPIPAKFRPKRLTRHRAAIDAYEHDPLIHRRVSVRLASDCFDAGQWALEHASTCHVPILGMHGTADSITNPAGTIRFCEAAPNAKLLLFEDLVHEPHNEADWRSVVGQVRDWIVHRIEAAPQILSQVHANSVVETLAARQ